MKKLIALFVAVAALSGCVEGTPTVTEATDTFDNDGTILRIEPAQLFNANDYGNPTRLGARWKQNDPDFVTLILQTHRTLSSGDYNSINGIAFNIDGQKQYIEVEGKTYFDKGYYNALTKELSTISTAYCSIPLSLFKAMLHGEDVRIRIDTSNGYEDSLFHVLDYRGGLFTTAKVYLLQFLEKIEEKQGAQS